MWNFAPSSCGRKDIISVFENDAWLSVLDLIKKKRTTIKMKEEEKRGDVQKVRSRK